jgi:hypothetical protein
MQNLISILLAAFLFFLQPLSAQQPSDHFSIEGEIARSIEIRGTALKTYPLVSLDSMTVYSHDMKAKYVMRNIKGILLKDILANADFNEKNPKALSAFYIECIATDGYKILYSWNELFNSETGNHAMIVTEKNGSDFTSQNDRIALITPTDKATGRRYLKSLSRIIIRSVN